MDEVKKNSRAIGKPLSIPLDLIASAKERKRGGSCTYILYSSELETLLHERFGRHNLCLKVFKASVSDLSTFPWHPKKDHLLTSCAKVQNLFALRGLAPFVYDIVLLNETSWAQVTDYVGGNTRPPTVETGSAVAKAVLKEFYITTEWDMNEDNWVNGWFVDFGLFHWKSPSRYVGGMRERIGKYASWGSNPLPYQGAFGLPSQRDMKRRVEMMKLDEIDFTGKTVLDLGCSLGLFCQDALLRGAKRAVGIERRVQATDIAYEVANWHECWNVDFLTIKFSKKPTGKEIETIKSACGLDSFDIIYALSVMQIGYHPWIIDMCDDMFYLEGHVPDKEHTYRERLEADFSEVEYLGITRDHGPRPLFRCRK